MNFELRIMNEMKRSSLRWILLFSYFIFHISFISAQTTEVKISKSTATIDKKKYYLHTVEKGQTLYAIAKAYGTTVSDILVDNPDAVDVVKVGQVLKISFAKVNLKKKKEPEVEVVETEEYYYHKVQQGETFYSIAKKFNVKQETLIKLNEESVGGLNVGTLIKIPGDPKELEKIDKQQTITTIVVKDTVPKKINTVFTGEKKFKVALFLPFQLNTIDYIDPEKIKKGTTPFPEKTKVAIEFYQGALMALDSLKKLGISVKLFVYDTGSDSGNFAEVAKKTELKGMDLFIGPLYSSNFIPVAKISKENNIPVVSPLTMNNKLLLGNVNVSKTTPSITTQVEQMANYIAQNYWKENIIIVNNPKGKDIAYVNAAKKIISDAAKDKNLPLSDTVKVLTGIYGVSTYLVKEKINIVIIPSSDPSTVTDYLSKLNKMKESTKDSIIVFGLHSWENIESIDIAYLNNLNVHLSSANYIDYNVVVTKSFIKTYRAKYNTEPTDYVFTGFDVMFYYVSAMAKYGPDNLQASLPECKSSGLHTGFDFYQSSIESGYENRRVFILRYSDSALVKMN